MEILDNDSEGSKGVGGARSSESIEDFELIPHTRPTEVIQQFPRPVFSCEVPADPVPPAPKFQYSGALPILFPELQVKIDAFNTQADALNRERSQQDNLGAPLTAVEEWTVSIRRSLHSLLDSLERDLEVLRQSWQKALETIKERRGKLNSDQLALQGRMANLGVRPDELVANQVAYEERKSFWETRQREYRQRQIDFDAGEKDVSPVIQQAKSEDLDAQNRSLQTQWESLQKEWEALNDVETELKSIALENDRFNRELAADNEHEKDARLLIHVLDELSAVSAEVRDRAAGMYYY